MSKIQWKSEANTHQIELGRGHMGDYVITLHDAGPKTLVKLDGTPIMEYIENGNGEVTAPKFLKGAEKVLAEAFHELPDM